MVECSQCLAEEMKEVGKWWRDGARALQWGGISDRMATQSLASSFSPSLKPIDGEWRSKKRCRLFSEQLWVELGRGVVVLWLSWSESRPIKLLKQRHTANLSLPFFLLAILPICPLTVGVLFERCDKTGCLYISTDIFKFVFSQTGAAHRDWERDIYQLRYLPPKTVELFSARRHTQRLFMHLSTQGNTSQIFVSSEYDLWFASRCPMCVCL